MTTTITTTARRAPAADAPAEFRDAMATLASGVGLVTTWIDSRPWALTVTAFTSVAADPPTILVSLRTDTATADAIRAGAPFGIALLAREQEPLARRSSARGEPKFLEPFAGAEPWSRSPVVAGALAHVDAELLRCVEVADHTVFFGGVRAARIAAGGAPLVYFRRAYGTHADLEKPLPTRRTR